MAYIGKKPTAAPLTSSDITDGIITTAKIAADAVTDAKIADDIVGTEHLTAGEVDATAIANDAITLAKMAGGTDGNIISYDASGDPVAISTGSDGQVLTSTGAGSPPAFEAAAAGGKILQVVSAVATSTQEVTATSYTDVTNVTADITPSATSSKIFISVCSAYSSPTDTYTGYYTILRDSTNLGDSTNGFGNVGSVPTRHWGYFAAVHVDSPSSTSALTYKLQAHKQSGGSSFYVTNNNAPSTIVLMEIGA